MSASTLLTPLQAAAAFGLGFGLNTSAVAAEFKVHRSTIHKMIDEIFNDSESSPSIRLKTAPAVLKQDWKLPCSTDFDTLSQPDDPLRNEMPPEPPEAPSALFDTFRHPDLNEINNVRNEMPPEPHDKPQPVRSHKIGRNVPCPCGSNLKYKRCCGK